MHLNVRGMTNQASIYEIEKAIHDFKVDIICVNETFLNSNHKIKTRNFKIYREDRPSHGGVVLIAIKSTIPHERLHKIQTSSIENVSIKITMNNHPVRITSAYCPKYTSSFIHDVEKITSGNEDFFIFGDFNGRHSSWTCLNSNKAGKKLYAHQLSSNYYIHYPASFTRFGQNAIPTQSSVLDVLLTNSSLDFSPIETHPGILSSDHAPISCQITGTTTVRTSTIPLYNKAN